MSGLMSREADLLVERFEGSPLTCRVLAPVQLMRNQIAGTDTPVFFDAIANGHWFSW
jgi:hypothetical protein